MVYSIHPGFTKNIEKKSLPDSYYTSNQTFPCDPLLLVLLRYCFHIKKAIMPNRLNNKTKMTHRYLWFSKLMTFQHYQYPNQQNQNISNFKKHWRHNHNFYFQ